MIKPPPLAAGDTIAAVSLSWGGPGTFPHRYEAGKRQLEAAFGVQVVPTRHALRNASWLARHPEARAEDLMEAFADPSIRGIVSTIGGDDSIRLLPYLDLEVIRANPKVFLGYSDTTVSHFACFKAGLVSFYGPSIMAGFGENGGLFPYMADAVRRTLFATEPVGEIAPNSDGWTVEHPDWADPSNHERPRALQPTTGWRFLQGRGQAEGHLIGGCLEVLDFLRGTSVWPEPEVWEGAMLFIETSEEAPSPEAVTRYLRSLAAMSILKKLSAILVGRPGGPIPPADFANYDAAILHVVAREEGLKQLPIVTRMDFGHTDPMFVLPYGIRARLDCDRQRFSLLESGVEA